MNECVVFYKMHFFNCKYIKKKYNIFLLFVTDNLVSSGSLDISTMCLLLRNLAGVQITTNLPHPADILNGSNLARIEYYRKKIVNSQLEISDTDFKLAWDTITEVSL